jgi:hypothetical protein
MLSLPEVVVNQWLPVGSDQLFDNSEDRRVERDIAPGSRIETWRWKTGTSEAADFMLIAWLWRAFYRIQLQREQPQRE